MLQIPVRRYVITATGGTVEPLYWPLNRGDLYLGVVLYTNCSFGTWVPGRSIAVGLYSGVVVKRSSTVVPQHLKLVFEEFYLPAPISSI